MEVVVEVEVGGPCVLRGLFGMYWLGVLLKTQSTPSKLDIRSLREKGSKNLMNNKNETWGLS